MDGSDSSSFLGLLDLSDKTLVERESTPDAEIEIFVDIGAETKEEVTTPIPPFDLWRLAGKTSSDE